MTRKHIIRVGAACAALAAVGLAPVLRSTPAHAAPIHFGAVLATGNESPAPAAPDAGASGFAGVTLDPETGEVCVTLWITSAAVLPPTAAHIHQAPAGTNGGIVVSFNLAAQPGARFPGCSSPGIGIVRAILANPTGFYVNAHSAASPGGFVRGQLSDSVFDADLSARSIIGSPFPPDGAGTASVVINDFTGDVCAYVQSYKLEGPPTAAHIHVGSKSVNGPVVVNLATPVAVPNNPNLSAFSAGCTRSPEMALNIIANPRNHYVAVHTDKYKAGAARGQLARRLAPPPGDRVFVNPVTQPPFAIL